MAEKTFSADYPENLYASLYYEYAYIFSWFLMVQFISCYDTKPSGLLSLISHGLIDCRRGLKLSM